MDNCHPISDTWNIWSHSSVHIDNNFTDIKHYQKLFTITNIEELLLISELIPESVLQKSMLFVMKNDINPFWEDPKNAQGGKFSYKFHIKYIKFVWNYFLYLLIGNSITYDDNALKNICGLTISPKKGGFIILGIWMTNCNFIHPRIFNPIKEFNIHDCLFIKHDIHKTIHKNFHKK